MNRFIGFAKARRRWLLKAAGATTIALAVVVGFGLRADAQTVPLSGKIVSASSSTGANIYTTPGTGTKFVLSQWCADIAIAPGDIVLVGNTFGFIAMIQGTYAVTGSAGEAACVSFSPGYVMPFHETISCGEVVDGAGPFPISIPCSISGVASAAVP